MFEKKIGKITEGEFKEIVSKLADIIEKKDVELKKLAFELESKNKQLANLNEYLAIEKQPIVVQLFMRAGFSHEQSLRIAEIIATQLELERLQEEVKAIKPVVKKEEKLDEK